MDRLELGNGLRQHWRAKALHGVRIRRKHVRQAVLDEAESEPA
jgi:hypothetical protein